MQQMIIYIAIFLISAAVFTFVGMFIRKKIAESKIQSAEQEAKRIVENAKVEAENLKKEDQWILTKLESTIRETKKFMDKYEFNNANSSISSIIKYATGKYNECE